MPNVLIVTSYGCTPCLRVKRILTDLQAEMPKYKSELGAKLSIENGIQYPPAVFINGELFAQGKIEANSMVSKIREGDVEVKS